MSAYRSVLEMCLTPPTLLEIAIFHQLLAVRGLFLILHVDSFISLISVITIA
jgi:hypothetical protein